MTTPQTDSADELARLVAECKKLGMELAHVYSFVGDDSMPIAKARFESAVDELAAYRTRPAPETAGAVHPQSLHGLVEAAGGTVVTGGGAAFTSVALAKFVVEIVAHQAPAPAQRMSESRICKLLRANNYDPRISYYVVFRLAERELASAWGVKLKD